MRVLFNTQAFRFQNPGGGETVIMELYNGLKRKNIDVTLFNQWEDRLIDFDIIHEFHCLQRTNWFYYKQQCKHLVVTPTHWPQTTFFKRLKYHTKDRLLKLRGHQTELSAMSIPDLYLPTTKKEMTQIEKHYRKDLPYKVLPNGVHIPSPPQDENQWKKHFNIDDYILFVANISPVKNLHRLIQVCNNLKLNLVIVGDASRENISYLEFCQNLSGPTIYYTGKLDQKSEDFNNVFYGARLLALPSLFETCGLVALEAGIRGIPIVITSKGATSEIYQEMAIYCNPEDESSIANAINRAGKNQDHQKLQTYIEENYSWDKIVDQLIKYYQVVLNQ